MALADLSKPLVGHPAALRGGGGSPALPPSGLLPLPPPLTTPPPRPPPPRRYSGFRYGSPEGRILQFLLYMRSSPDDNHYAHPLDTIIFYDYHADRWVGGVGGWGALWAPADSAGTFLVSLCLLAARLAGWLEGHVRAHPPPAA